MPIVTNITPYQVNLLNAYDTNDDATITVSTVITVHKYKFLSNLRITKLNSIITTRKYQYRKKLKSYLALKYENTYTFNPFSNILSYTKTIFFSGEVYKISPNFTISNTTSKTKAIHSGQVLNSFGPVFAPHFITPNTSTNIPTYKHSKKSIKYAQLSIA